MDEKTRKFIERQRMLGASQEIVGDSRPSAADRESWMRITNAFRARRGLPPQIDRQAGRPLGDRRGSSGKAIG